jgi:hypothetical protein
MTNGASKITTRTAGASLVVVIGLISILLLAESG